ncbi:MAG: hypothetical protein R8M45_00405 [Ghiorsea sp.]
MNKSAATLAVFTGAAVPLIYWLGGGDFDRGMGLAFIATATLVVIALAYSWCVEF